MRARAIVVVACVCAMAVGPLPAVAAERSPPPHIETRADVVYQTLESRALHVDVHRLRATRPTPVWVYVHGGGWSRGQRPAAEAFSAAYAMGYSVVTVEYRLADEASAPAAVQDVRCALAWVQRAGADYGLDSQRVVVEGGSAGAHLALLAVAAADDPDFDVGCGALPHVLAVVDRFGITDVAAWHPPSGAVQRWLGARADDTTWKRQLSPVSRLHAGMPPIFIVHGDADPVVPIAQSRQLLAAATALGIPAQLKVVAGGKHGGFDVAQEARIANALRIFLRSHGAPAF